MRNKKFLFVGSRFGVLNHMIQNQLNVIALLPNNVNNQIPKSTAYYIFHNKNELLGLIQTIDFDILVSNGCPYILPVSRLRRQHQIFINIHPSLLPSLRGPHPVNGAIMLGKKTGSTCHFMDDNIDHGAIISQVAIQNDSSIGLALLYQMCFLAEIQAFDIALKNNFIQQSHRKQSDTYFKRTDENMTLDFAVDETSVIIKKVQAFNIKGQYAKFFSKEKNYLVKSANAIQNRFLSQHFKNALDNTIVLLYENFILIKRADDFLELEILGGIWDLRVGESLVSKQQISIYQTLEYSSCLTNKQFQFEFSKNNQTFYNLSEISNIPHTKLNDMTSPYGYSGYFTNSTDLDFIKKAIEMQSEQAKEKNIIAEFIRFNPYQNHQIFANFLDFYTFEKKMVEVDTNYIRRWDNYQPRFRTKIRTSLSKLSIRVSHNFEKFFELYTQTMQRNRANSSYYFPLEYFYKLSNLDGFIMLEAAYGKEVCAMAIFLCDKNRSYYHLGANSTITLDKNLNAMGAILETFFQYAEQNNINTCLLGGGRTSDSNDTLLQYKKQYSSTMIDFYIGGKIYDHQAYKELSKNRQNNFFLKYRYPVKGGGVK